MVLEICIRRHATYPDRFVAARPTTFDSLQCSAEGCKDVSWILYWRIYSRRCGTTAVLTCVLRSPAVWDRETLWQELPDVCVLRHPGAVLSMRLSFVGRALNLTSPADCSYAHLLTHSVTHLAFLRPCSCTVRLSPADGDSVGEAGRRWRVR